MDKYSKSENCKLNFKLENYKHDVDQIKETYNLYQNKSMDTFASNSTIDENKIVNINDFCNTCILQNNEKNPEKNASFSDENKSNNMMDFLKTPLINENNYNNYINEINKELKSTENMNTYMDNYNDSFTNQTNKFNNTCINCSYNNDSYICKDMNCTIDFENYEFNNYNQNDASKLLKMYINKIFQDYNIKDKTQKNTNYNEYSENIQPSNFSNNDNNNNIVSEIIKEINIKNYDNSEICNRKNDNVITKNIVNKIQNYLKNSNSISTNIENENNLQQMIMNEIRKTDLETNGCCSCQTFENNKICKKIENKPIISIPSILVYISTKHLNSNVKMRLNNNVFPIINNNKLFKYIHNELILGIFNLDSNKYIEQLIYSIKKCLIEILDYLKDINHMYIYNINDDEYFYHFREIMSIEFSEIDMNSIIYYSNIYKQIYDKSEKTKKTKNDKNNNRRIIRAVSKIFLPYLNRCKIKKNNKEKNKNSENHFSDFKNVKEVDEKEKGEECLINNNEKNKTNARILKRRHSSIDEKNVHKQIKTEIASIDLNNRNDSENTNLLDTDRTTLNKQTCIENSDKDASDFCEHQTKIEHGEDNYDSTKVDSVCSNFKEIKEKKDKYCDAYNKDIDNNKMEGVKEKKDMIQFGEVEKEITNNYSEKCIKIYEKDELFFNNKTQIYKDKTSTIDKLETDDIDASYKSTFSSNDVLIKNNEIISKSLENKCEEKMSSENCINLKKDTSLTFDNHNKCKLLLNNNVNKKYGIKKISQNKEMSNEKIIKKIKIGYINKIISIILCRNLLKYSIIFSPILRNEGIVSNISVSIFNNMILKLKNIRIMDIENSRMRSFYMYKNMSKVNSENYLTFNGFPKYTNINNGIINSQFFQTSQNDDKTSNNLYALYNTEEKVINKFLSLIPEKIKSQFMNNTTKDSSENNSSYNINKIKKFVENYLKIKNVSSTPFNEFSELCAGIENIDSDNVFVENNGKVIQMLRELIIKYEEQTKKNERNYGNKIFVNNINLEKVESNVEPEVENTQDENTNVKEIEKGDDMISNNSKFNKSDKESFINFLKSELLEKESNEYDTYLKNLLNVNSNNNFKRIIDEKQTCNIFNEDNINNCMNCKYNENMNYNQILNICNKLKYLNNLNCENENTTLNSTFKGIIANKIGNILANNSNILNKLISIILNEHYFNNIFLNIKNDNKSHCNLDEYNLEELSKISRQNNDVKNVNEVLNLSDLNSKLNIMKNKNRDLLIPNNYLEYRNGNNFYSNCSSCYNKNYYNFSKKGESDYKENNIENMNNFNFFNKNANCCCLLKCENMCKNGLNNKEHDYNDSMDFQNIMKHILEKNKSKEINNKFYSDLLNYLQKLCDKNNGEIMGNDYESIYNNIDLNFMEVNQNTNDVNINNKNINFREIQNLFLKMKEELSRECVRNYNNKSDQDIYENSNIRADNLNVLGFGNKSEEENNNDINLETVYKDLLFKRYGNQMQLNIENRNNNNNNNEENNSNLFYEYVKYNKSENKTKNDLSSLYNYASYKPCLSNMENAKKNSNNRYIIDNNLYSTCLCTGNCVCYKSDYFKIIDNNDLKEYLSNLSYSNMIIDTNNEKMGNIDELGKFLLVSVDNRRNNMHNCLNINKNDEKMGKIISNNSSNLFLNSNNNNGDNILGNTTSYDNLNFMKELYGNDKNNMYISCGNNNTNILRSNKNKFGKKNNYNNLNEGEHKENNEPHRNTDNQKIGIKVDKNGKNGNISMNGLFVSYGRGQRTKGLEKNKNSADNASSNKNSGNTKGNGSKRGNGKDKQNGGCYVDIGENYELKYTVAELKPQRGVYFDKSQKAWIGSWYEEGKQIKRRFKIKYYGWDEAKELATKARFSFENRIKNLEGNNGKGNSSTSKNNTNSGEKNGTKLTVVNNKKSGIQDIENNNNDRIKTRNSSKDVEEKNNNENAGFDENNFNDIDNHNNPNEKNNSDDKKKNNNIDDEIWSNQESQNCDSKIRYDKDEYKSGVNTRSGHFTKKNNFNNKNNNNWLGERYADYNNLDINISGQRSFYNAYDSGNGCEIDDVKNCSNKLYEYEETELDNKNSNLLNSGKKGYTKDNNFNNNNGQIKYQNNKYNDGNNTITYAKSNTKKGCDHNIIDNSVILPQGVFYQDSKKAFCANWYSNGKQEKRYFSINKFGEERARSLAIAARKKFENLYKKNTKKDYVSGINNIQQIENSNSEILISKKNDNLNEEHLNFEKNESGIDYTKKEKEMNDDKDLEGNNNDENIIVKKNNYIDINNMGIGNRCNTRNGSKNISFDYNSEHGFENENNHDDNEDNKKEDENRCVQNLNKNENEKKKIINQVNRSISTDVIKEHLIDNIINSQGSKHNEEYHIDCNEENSDINHFKNNNLEMNDNKENGIINIENDNYDGNCLNNDTIPKICNNDHNIEDNNFDVTKMTEQNMGSHLLLQRNDNENKEISIKDMNINDYNMENDSNYVNSNNNKESEEDMFAKNSQKDDLSPYNKSDKAGSIPSGVYVIRTNGVVQAWRAEWKSSNGCKKTKNFGISTYGYDLSKKLAIEMRARMAGECLVADDGTIFDYRNKVESKDE
ncbi:transcription factor with AP2 domain(s), putative [Plasmodium berghei]|uniref:Transcription factor with AP2 domain(S), putative n=1 Tax=Plasmodium berghei TaxID=5821 RepID=A0A0Y9TEN5_PLABE|nr:transcription factor with AP2 domain(s), putative [Plasmodium berghei]SCM19275.1 transcription factor with AP2 domain(s), putative [Plasmodium berghei]SCN21720.1 transcription factor with AP2 domain(s), putative [Plasmodium berghei]